MKLVTFYLRNEARVGVQRVDWVYDVAVAVSAYEREKSLAASSLSSDVAGLLASGESAVERIAEAVAHFHDVHRVVDDSGRPLAHGVGDVRLGPPVPRPGKIICLAGNYPEHIAESGWITPPKDKMTPWLFMKPATGLNGPDQPVYLPRLSEQVDWEVELAFVIGKRGRYIPAAKAYDYVAGYTIFNDVSGRTIKVPPTRGQREWDPFYDWLHGKWFDTFACMGPALVLKDEVPDPMSLKFELRVNGVLKQGADTSHMIFTIPEIVEFASAIMTLEPGDVISTGTGSGVGEVSATYLKPGDVMEAGIERLGMLRNPVAVEPANLGG